MRNLGAVCCVYCGRIRVSNFDGAKQIGTPFENAVRTPDRPRYRNKESPSSTCAQKIQMLPTTTNAHKLTTAVTKYLAARRVPSDGYTYLCPFGFLHEWKTNKERSSLPKLNSSAIELLAIMSHCAAAGTNHLLYV